MEAIFYDITEWTEKPYLNTKGTRDKCVVSEPGTGTDFFFKTSLLKENRDYKTEFWSEIIASKIGQFLGFNVLDYNIAKRGLKIGCLSKNMLSTNEQLVEGINLLTGYDNAYKPEDKESYTLYTFHFIKDALSFWSLSENIKDIIKTIIFDAIIGNSDRHQENWGFIAPYKEQTFTEDEAASILRRLKERFKQFRELVKSKNIKEEGVKIKLRISQLNGRYAPIYDSGCCLAREKTDDAVRQMLNDNIMLESFINRGKAEIRWGANGDKLNHFDLIIQIRKEYQEIVDENIKKVISIYDIKTVEKIVYDIDMRLPEEFRKGYSLSKERKELICKLIDRRIKRLKDIVS